MIRENSDLLEIYSSRIFWFLNLLIDGYRSIPYSKRLIESFYKSFYCRIEKYIGTFSSHKEK